MDKRQQLLNAALKLFVAYGFHGTPTSLIAKEAGVANGTLFHYFSTKDELVIALYTDIKKRMAGDIFEHVKVESTFKQTIRGQYIAALYWALENRLEFQFTEQFKTSPFLQMIAPKEIEESLQPYYAMLNKAIAEKEIKPYPVELLYTVFNSHIYGVNQYLLAHDLPKAQLHQVITDSFDMLWAMVAK